MPDVSRGDADVGDGAYRVLSRAYIVSSVGSGVGASELALVAVLALHAPAYEVSVLAAVTALSGACLAIPVGAALAGRSRLAVLRATDAVRCLALALVSAGVVCGLLRFWELCVAGAVIGVATIASNATMSSSLKKLHQGSELNDANSRLETVKWLTQSGGPPIGGGLISLCGVAAATVCDAASFLASATMLGGARHSAPLARERTAEPGGREMLRGWRAIMESADLSRLLMCSALFGGSVMMLSPLLAVFALRTLRMEPWQYGLAIGLACVAGIGGAQLSRCLVNRHGARPVVLISGAFRAVWIAVLCAGGVLVSPFVAVVVSEALLLFGAGCFAPALATYRMQQTNDAAFTSMALTWSACITAVQPVFILAGGAAANLIGVRGAIGVTAGLAAISVLFLPWRLGQRHTVRGGAIARPHRTSLAEHEQ